MSTSARAGSARPAWAHLLRHPALAHVTYYIETPGMDEGYDAINIARAYDIAACRPLADLPPEAMTLRGSRARPDRTGPGCRRPGTPRPAATGRGE